ncbi:MAG: DUF4176 domain-containing protein [Streptococcaceae bacterium]|jgi:hypothetical protein|nr:DUF4176 domain-containing protein [Streptococcaceae bacterium]
MENKKFLPLGSIVIVIGTTQKIIIVQRAINYKEKNVEKYFDYGAVMYPEGLMGTEIIYFNQEDIFKIVHEGYTDEDEKIYKDQLEKALEIFESQLENQESENSFQDETVVVEDDDPFASVRDLEDDE